MFTNSRLEDVINPKGYFCLCKIIILFETRTYVNGFIGTTIAPNDSAIPNGNETIDECLLVCLRS